MEDVFMKLHRTPEHPFLVERLLGGLDNWDAEHFIFNARAGYNTHEHAMAFFPMLPIIMWTLSRTLFLPLSFIMPDRSVMLISGVFLNLMAFPLATVTLYLLTYELSRDKRLAVLAAALFSLNPASVFMSAVYSETLFALFTFSGLLALEKKCPWLSSLAFSLAVFTRSNGIVLCGFLGYQCLTYITETLFDQTDGSTWRKLWSCVTHMCVTALQCLVAIAPFCGFQVYGYILYCRGPPSFSTRLPVWCNHTLPLPYSFIQKHYWNVGFLRYYEMKQIPNFLLASPMVVLVMLCAGCYFTGGDSLAFWRARTPPNIGSRTGKDGGKSGGSRTSDGGSRSGIRSRESGHDEVQDSQSQGTVSSGSEAAQERRSGCVRVKRSDSVGTLCSTSRLRPYMFHLLFLTTFGALNMHIQVSHETGGASPPLYRSLDPKGTLYSLTEMTMFYRITRFLKSGCNQLLHFKIVPIPAHFR